MTENKEIYREIKPIEKLQDLVHSFWNSKNITEKPEELIIVPDSYAKIIFIVQDDKVIQYFMSGFWIHENHFTMPPKSNCYGCRLKILAPEYLLNREFSSLLQDFTQLDLSFLNLNHFDFSCFEKVVQQWQIELLKLKSSQTIAGNKLRLSQFVEATKGDITVKEVSEQIFWSRRQINRYMNKYLGMSLKRYLNIKRVYHSLPQIRAGNFFPKKSYFDQAHFIREVKKHTGHTPSKLYQGQNDRFIQLKNIKEK